MLYYRAEGALSSSGRNPIGEFCSVRILRRRRVLLVSLATWPKKETSSRDLSFEIYNISLVKTRSRPAGRVKAVGISLCFGLCFKNRFSPLTRANRVRQERPKIKLILAPPPSIPEILSAELGCYQGESRIRDFQRQKVKGGANLKLVLRRTSAGICYNGKIRSEPKRAPRPKIQISDF